MTFFNSSNTSCFVMRFLKNNFSGILQTVVFVFHTTAEDKCEGSDPVINVQARGILLLTVPRRYFCCGSSVLFVMLVCIWSSAI